MNDITREKLVELGFEPQDTFDSIYAIELPNLEGTYQSDEIHLEVDLEIEVVNLFYHNTNGAFNTKDLIYILLPNIKTINDLTVLLTLLK
jgi:hypothetical protein